MKVEEKQKPSKSDQARAFMEEKEEVEEAIKDLRHQEEEQHGDECDCIKCLARREKGGLDYDPTNDNEEFEEHEQQVFRDTGIDKEEK